MKEKKRILVAPLDWGIGHSTRCIPIINALLKHNFEVIIAADGRPLHLLSVEFPQLEIIRFAGYNIKYSTYLPMILSMLLQIPKILWRIKKENSALAEIITDYDIDGVISDNRFGLFSNKIPCVFITHQLQIKSPYFTNNIRNFNYSYINKFDACWVMDNEKENLAGNLSKPNILPKKSIYIGPQSRFENQEIEKKYDFLAIVSGPEPQRTILERGLIEALKNRKERSLIVLGKPEVEKEEKIGSLTIKSHLKAIDLNTAILQSDLVICRPGYSTIMDLAKLGRKAILIPTPGQTEQEYLANYYMKKNIAFTQNQKEFSLAHAIKESKSFSGFTDSFKKSTDWNLLLNIFK